MLTRIKHIQKLYHVTNEQIAQETGIGKWTISKQLNGVYKLNIDVVLALLRLCPDVSADWLLMGRGDITHADTRAIINRIDILTSKIDTIANSNIKEVK